MTQRNILSVALKILGVAILMYTIVLISKVGYAIGLLFAPHDTVYTFYVVRWHFVWTLVYPIFAFICGLILLKWGDAITKKLIREDTEVDVTPTEGWERRIFLISLRIIGVISLIRGVPDFTKAIGELVMRWYIYYYMTSHVISVIVASSLSVLIGIYLLIDARHLVRLAFREQVEILEAEGER